MRRYQSWWAYFDWVWRRGCFHLVEELVSIPRAKASGQQKLNWKLRTFCKLVNAILTAFASKWGLTSWNGIDDMPDVRWHRIRNLNLGFLDERFGQHQLLFWLKRDSETHSSLFQVPISSLEYSRFSPAKTLLVQAHLLRRRRSLSQRLRYSESPKG